ncbi:PREDICTED: carbohydrate sulfotransferase 1-like, partial [Priapulus caudatus]|uniref:Carbohydrate sulfotransferase 1-like n=1 Tax=Priapulus caudatus TaxID=37621 RepID=A0ABM1EF38_PRICU
AAVGGKPTRVVIAAYMRTGSTFFGEAFNSHADVFYMDEPLHYTCNSVNSKKLLVGLRNLPSKSVGLRGLLTCDYSGLDDVIAYSKSPKLDRMFRRCRALHDYLNCTTRYPANAIISACPVERLSTATIAGICRRHGIVVGKVIWERLNFLGLLIDRVPALHVIHLIRDPRAVLNSHALSFGAKTFARQLPFVANGKCAGMLQQYEHGERVLKLGKNSQRYMLVKYEDLATRTLDTLERVFAFVGRRLDAGVRRYVDTHTHGTSALHRHKHDLLTYREDSARTAQAWRTEMSERDVKIVETNPHCRKLLLSAGYELVYPNVTSYDVAADRRYSLSRDPGDTAARLRLRQKLTGRSRIVSMRRNRWR